MALFPMSKGLVKSVCGFSNRKMNLKNSTTWVCQSVSINDVYVLHFLQPSPINSHSTV